MKIAIASEGKEESSSLCTTAGRSPYYLLFEDSSLIKVIRNPFSVGGRGAGYGVAQMLANETVDIVISGRFGENMRSSLDSKGIKVRETDKLNVSEALRSLDLPDKT